MLFTTFYTSYSLQKSVSSAAPETLDGDRIKYLLQEGVRGEDDFLGIIDKEGRVLQFMVRQTGGYLAEIVQPEEKCSLQQTLSASELIAFMDNLPSNLANLDLSGFSLEHWPLDTDNA
jgi:hypothetical protein